MSILVDKDTRLIVQGITGREGQFHTAAMLDYGTKVVAGVRPGKGGGNVHGVPVFSTVDEAVDKTGANATILFVPAMHTQTAVYEAIDANVPLIITVSEHTPVHDMMKCYYAAREKGLRLFGPNSFGIISPGKCKAGFMESRYYLPGQVGVMSRSATNCYEAVKVLSENGIGQSTCIGIGGDLIPGSTFIDLLPDFEEDEDTEAIVLIGEIGGNDEETAADYIKKRVTKPVVAFIAGKNAPKGKMMGHAGAIVSVDGTGSAEHKEDALRQAGAYVAGNMEEIVELLQTVL